MKGKTARIKWSVIIFTILFLQVVSANQGLRAEENGENKDAFKKGRSIMEEVEKRAKSINEHTFLTMIIRDSAGKERERKLEVWNKYDQEVGGRLPEVGGRLPGRRKNLMRFTGPQMVRNTALLSLESEAGGDDDQWLYLPILRKSKRIAASAKTNEFVGTDFTFEDLSAENIDEFKYEYKGEREIDNHSCFIVKAIPLERRLNSTGYKERVIFVREDIYSPVQIHHYDRDGRFYKKWLASDFIKIKDECWKPNKEEMIKVTENKCTILLTDKRITDNTLNDTIFTQRELTKEY